MRRPSFAAAPRRACCGSCSSGGWRRAGPTASAGTCCPTGSPCWCRRIARRRSWPWSPTSRPASSTSRTVGPASRTCSSTCSSRARRAAASAPSPARPRARAGISTPAPPTTTLRTSRCCPPPGWPPPSTSRPMRSAIRSSTPRSWRASSRSSSRKPSASWTRPSAVAYETLHEVMFDRHRIRRWRIGHEAALAKFTRADVHGYYASRYVPERTIVSIVGAVNPDEALALARDAYGTWPAAAGAVDPSPEEPPRRGVRARTLRGDVTQAELSLGWRAVPPLDREAPALDVAAAVLGAGRGSWLYRELREPGLVTWVTAHYYAPTELGLFGVSAELAPARVPEALDAIAAATGRLALLGPVGRGPRAGPHAAPGALGSPDGVDGGPRLRARGRRSARRLRLPRPRVRGARRRRAGRGPRRRGALPAARRGLRRALPSGGRCGGSHRRRGGPSVRRLRAAAAGRRLVTVAARTRARSRQAAGAPRGRRHSYQSAGRRPAGAPEARRAAGEPGHLRTAP